MHKKAQTFAIRFTGLVQPQIFYGEVCALRILQRIFVIAR